MQICKHNDCSKKTIKNSDFCILHTPKDNWFNIEGVFKMQNWSKSKKNINKFWINIISDLKPIENNQLCFKNITFPEVTYEDIVRVIKKIKPTKKHLFQEDNIDYSISFDNCTFIGPVDFWHFKFKQSIFIKNCIFYTLGLEGSTIDKDLKIEGSHFNMYLNLCRVRSKSKIIIDEITMDKDCEFDFHGFNENTINFSDITFTSKLDKFSNASSSQINFYNVEFKESVNITSQKSNFNFDQCKLDNEFSIYSKDSNIHFNKDDEERKQENYRSKINYSLLIYGSCKILELNNIDIKGQVDLKLRSCDKLYISNTISYNDSAINFNNNIDNEFISIDNFYIYNSNFRSRLNLLNLKINDEFSLVDITVELLELFNLDLSNTPYVQINNVSMTDTKINNLNFGKTNDIICKDIDTSFFKDVKYYSEKQMDFTAADNFYNIEMRKREKNEVTYSRKSIMLIFKWLSDYGQNWIRPFTLFLLISIIFYISDNICPINKNFISECLINKTFLSNFILYMNPLNLKPDIENFKVNNYPLFYIYKLISLVLIYQVFITIKRIVRRK